MQFNTIRFKASILYSLVLAIILSIFGGIIYLNLQKVLYGYLDKELEVKAQEIKTILNAYEKIKQRQNHPFQGLLNLLENEGLIEDQKMVIDDIWRSKFEILHLKADYINILNIQGNTLVNSNNFTPKVAKLFESQLPVSLKEKQFKTLKEGGVKIRAINLPVIYQDKQLVLQIGTPLRKTSEILSNTFVLLIALILFILLLTSFLGGFLAERALIPVKSAIEAANNIIKHKDLSIRVEEHQADVEMKELVKSFNNLLSQLEISFNHITEFSSRVAHELKTPLAITKGELEVALDQDRNKEEYKRVIEECLQETDRMIRVIKDLLLLAKLDYKREIYKFEKLNINNLLKEIYEQSGVLATAKNIQVNLEIPENDIFIRADKVHLRRLFLNLINNAINYTPENGEVKIGATSSGSNVSVNIEDNGVGISEENLDKIFDKFFRIKKDAPSEASGTGLGLNIAQSIAHAHNGEISVKSQLGKGSTFTVTLPQA